MTLHHYLYSLPYNNGLIVVAAAAAAAIAAASTAIAYVYTHNHITNKINVHKYTPIRTSIGQRKGLFSIIITIIVVVVVYLTISLCMILSSDKQPRTT